MTQLVFALRGAAAVAILTTLVGGLPRIVQLGLAVALGLWAVVVAAPPAPPDDVIWLVAVRELAIGATLGIVAAIPLLAAAMAGKLVDVVQQSRGEGPYATLFGILAAAVFVGIDGHVTFATAIADSYAAAPSIGETQPRVLAALGGLIGAGVKLAVPWLVTGVVVELARGVGMRLGGRAAQHAPLAAAVPAAIAMMTATLVATLAVAIAAAIRGTL